MSAHRSSSHPELGIQDIVKATGYTQVAIEAMIRRGDFPRPDLPGTGGRGNGRRWRKQTLLNWLLENESRIGAKYRACRRSISELQEEIGM